MAWWKKHTGSKRKRNDKNFEVELAAPGYKKEDFNFSIDNGMLTVSGERKDEHEKNENTNKRREFGCSSFSRSFSLPQNTNEDDISARYEGRILKLTIAKKEQLKDAGKKRIDIQ